MAAYTSSGYAVADIAALKAIAPADRPASGSGIYARAYVTEMQWFEFDSDAVSGGIAPDSGTGRWFPLGRETLRANRTYYVRTDGNDNNSGLANTSGGAFLTWAKAQDVIASLDGNGFGVTVQFTGNFTTGINISKSFIGLSFLQIDGDTVTPSNATITVSSGDAFTSSTVDTLVNIRGLRLVSGVSGNGLSVFAGTVVINGNMQFGASGNSQIYIGGQKAQLNQRSNYSINGASASHIQVYDQGLFDANGSGHAVTITGTPTFAASFIIVGRSSSALFVNVSYSGSTIGKQYEVQALSGLYVVGTTFPGTTGGTTAPTGFYGI